jgi:hypothetical protein
MTPHLSLEPLEARETPAIVFVGGWGSSMYQSSSGVDGPRWKIDFSLHSKHQQVFEADGNTIYVSTTGGGAWKTTNGGQSWMGV